MRRILLVLLLLPAACASHQDEMGKAPTSLAVGSAALSSGIPGVALAIAQRDLAAAPDNVPALLVEGNALSEMDRVDGAEASFRKAVRLSPRSPAAQMALGRLLLGTGHAAEAEGLFRRVLGTNPADPRAENDLGIALDLQGRHLQAQESYETALKQAPDMEGPRVNLGLSYALNGQAPRAVEILRPLAMAPGASPKIRQDLALALTASGNAEDARLLLQKDMSASQVSVAMAGYQQFASGGE